MFKPFKNIIFVGNFFVKMRIFIFIAIVILVEWYSYILLNSFTKNRWIQLLYGIINLSFLVYSVYFFLNFDRSKGQSHYSMYMMGLLLLVYLPKVMVALLFLGQDFIRFFIGIFQKIAYNTDTFLPDRRKFISQIGLGIAAIPFLSILYGITKGKYNFKVHRQQIFFDDLPDAFDGFRILQISDLHCGSFDDAEKIQYGVNLINEQEADVIVFTGDLVNSLAEEVDPWIEILSKIKTPEYGKYSILGNHDYGEYVKFDSEKEKEDNFSAIKKQHAHINFRLLLNEHLYLTKNTAKIALVGVENWGVNFKKAGDLAVATEGLHPNDFKILLTHDPSHWDAEVVNHQQHYHLTLSGHTHGMQFGIEIPGWFKWSPSEYIYKQWAGLYQKGQQYIYVNRGFGFHAYAGRVGIMPEITVLELKKSV